MATAMLCKLGQILYTVSYDDGTGKFETDEWVVRTIRGGMVTAIEKNKFTWVKRSTKHGDWGWETNIPSVWRETWPQGMKEPGRLSFTKLDAWKKERDILSRWMDEGPERDKALRTANAMLTRHTKGKK